MPTDRLSSVSLSLVAILLRTQAGTRVASHLSDPQPEPSERWDTMETLRLALSDTKLRIFLVTGHD